MHEHGRRAPLRGAFGSRLNVEAALRLGMTHMMLSGCTILPLVDEDRPEVYALIGAIYQEYGMTLVLEDEAEQHLLNPSEYFRGNGGEFWVVRDMDAHLVATAAVHLDPSHPETAELKSLYVAKANRRSGVGRTLTTLAMRYAKSHGRTKFILWSDTRLTAAHGLYESMGFTRCDERDIVDSNNSHEYGFEIALTD